MEGKEIKPVHPKGNQPWIFVGRTDAEAETPILWPPDAKSQLTGKDPDAGKDWGQEEKGMTEDEMVGWHHQLDGHEFEQTLGDSERQWSLVCCSPWGHKESGRTEQLNNYSNWALSVAPAQQPCHLPTRPGMWGLHPSNSAALLRKPGQVTNPFRTTSSFPWQETIAIGLFLVQNFFFFNRMKIYSKTQI